VCIDARSLIDGMMRLQERAGDAAGIAEEWSGA
jgi:hypothetical protein